MDDYRQLLSLSLKLRAKLLSLAYRPSSPEVSTQRQKVSEELRKVRREIFRLKHEPSTN